jgi:hypothetical protein
VPSSGGFERRFEKGRKGEREKGRKGEREKGSKGEREKGRKGRILRWQGQVIYL